MIVEEEKFEVATEIGLMVGYLEICPVHEYVFSAEIDGELMKNACALGNFFISKKKPIVEIFQGNRRELTDKIQETGYWYPLGCPGCEKSEGGEIFRWISHQLKKE